MNLMAIPALAGATMGTIAIGFLSKWIDRKVTARIQWRVGPPWYQPLADVIKLMGKETLLPESARGTGFLMMPLVGFAAAAVAATILWWATFNPGSGFVGDTIVVLYLLTIPALMTILGGSASGNPLAAVGAAREMKLALAYELPLLISVLAAVMARSGDFRLGGLIETSPQGVFSSLACVLGFLVAILCIQAKLGLVPFDIAEADCEIATGPFIEYSGVALAMILLTRTILFALLPIFLITIFWGGLNFYSITGVLATIGKYVLIIVLMVLIRNTNPRVRIDQAMKFFWFGMTPIALIALMLALI